MAHATETHVAKSWEGFSDEVHTSSKQKSISGRGSSAEDYGGIVGSCGMVRATGRCFTWKDGVRAEYECNHSRPGSRSQRCSGAQRPGRHREQEYGRDGLRRSDRLRRRLRRTAGYPRDLQGDRQLFGPEGRSHRRPCRDSRAGRLGEHQYANWRSEPGGNGSVKGRTN
jgi:hypothetical protein